MGQVRAIHFKPKPGHVIIFPGYLEHEYAVDHGKEPLDLYIGIYKLYQKKWLKMFKEKKYTVIKQAISKDLAAFISKLFFNAKTSL